jgi:hypothetical protein
VSVLRYRVEKQMDQLRARHAAGCRQHRVDVGEDETTYEQRRLRRLNIQSIAVRFQQPRQRIDDLRHR